MIEPSPTAPFGALRAWRAASEQASLFGTPLTEWQRSGRAVLGLAIDRPIIVTGHQAGIWHAGILAKWFLADALANRCAGEAAALVVDHDVNHAHIIAYPALVDGTLTEAFLPVPKAPRGGPTALQPAVHFNAPETPPVPEVTPQLHALREVLNAQSDAQCIAEQMARATSDLLRPYIKPMATVFATRIMTTPIAEALVAAMQRDPVRCIDAYNAAVASDRQAVRPLAADELPLWRLTATGRLPVRADNGTGPLAPRALFMTAITRIALCDLFVHGTGGARYERLTEAWIRAWLGIELAPMSVATATLRLPLEIHLGDRHVTTPAELRRVEFDPDLVALPSSSHGPSLFKRSLLAAIAAAPRGSRERRGHYQTLRHQLDERRDANRELITRLRADVESSRAEAASAQLARSRTWPWPLHAPERLHALHEATRKHVSFPDAADRAGRGGCPRAPRSSP
ncbi:MAG: hypothetical protein SGJ11_01830 [Phycisphaerae bacterium]|nr:hypothetical protein [Phycisphaerae bacterium]